MDACKTACDTEPSNALRTARKASGAQDDALAAMAASETFVACVGCRAVFHLATYG